MTVNPGVGPVVRQRLRLSRRQKVGIFGVGTALVLARTDGGPSAFPARPSRKIPGSNSPAPPACRSRAPAPPEPRPRNRSRLRRRRLRLRNRRYCRRRPARPRRPTIRGPPAPYSPIPGLNGPEAGSNVQRGSGGSGGAKDDLSAALVHSDLGATAHATIMKHPVSDDPGRHGDPVHPADRDQQPARRLCRLYDPLGGARCHRHRHAARSRHPDFWRNQKRFARRPKPALHSVGPRPHPRKRRRYVRLPAADELGRAGVGGYVNDHFWSRFGAALLYSLIDYGPQLAVAALQRNNGNFGTSNYVQFVQPQQQLANTILQDQLNIPPTLEKNQGETVSIFVARDVDFSGVYDLKTSE